MKKYLLIVSLSIFTILVVFADDNKFNYALKNCSTYSESGTVSTEGMEVTSRKQILGWENDKCIYKETINFMGIDTTVTCSLSKAQIDELSSVMQAYSLVRKYSDEKVDTSSLQAVQDNPVVKVWNKYLNDKSTCSMSGIK